jgi:hypothetical protein
LLPFVSGRAGARHSTDNRTQDRSQAQLPFIWCRGVGACHMGDGCGLGLAMGLAGCGSGGFGSPGVPGVELWSCGRPRRRTTARPPPARSQHEAPPPATACPTQTSPGPAPHPHKPRRTAQQPTQQLSALPPVCLCTAGARPAFHRPCLCPSLSWQRCSGEGCSVAHRRHPNARAHHLKRRRSPRLLPHWPRVALRPLRRTMTARHPSCGTSVNPKPDPRGAKLESQQCSPLVQLRATSKSADSSISCSEAKNGNRSKPGLRVVAAVQRHHRRQKRRSHWRRRTLLR